MAPPTSLELIVIVWRAEFSALESIFDLVDLPPVLGKGFVSLTDFRVASIWLWSHFVCSRANSFSGIAGILEKAAHRKASTTHCWFLKKADLRFSEGKLEVLKICKGWQMYELYRILEKVLLRRGEPDIHKILDAARCGSHYFCKIGTMFYHCAVVRLKISGNIIHIITVFPSCERDGRLHGNGRYYESRGALRRTSQEIPVELPPAQPGYNIRALQYTGVEIWQTRLQDTDAQWGVTLGL